jgi:hypothetical protein
MYGGVRESSPRVRRSGTSESPLSGFGRSEQVPDEPVGRRIEGDLRVAATGRHVSGALSTRYSTGLFSSRSRSTMRLDSDLGTRLVVLAVHD